MVVLILPIRPARYPGARVIDGRLNVWLGLPDDYFVDCAMISCVNKFICYASGKQYETNRLPPRKNPPEFDRVSVSGKRRTVDLVVR